MPRYLYKKQTAILRCAQPMAGVQGKRSEDDEAVIEAVFRANPSDKPVMIVDTRPKLNARANALKGKGFENISGWARRPAVCSPAALPRLPPVCPPPGAWRPGAGLTAVE